MSWGTISFSSVVHGVSYSDRHAVNVVVWWYVGMLVELLFVHVQLTLKLRFYKVWHRAVWRMGTVSVKERFVSDFRAAGSIPCLWCQGFSTKSWEVMYRVLWFHYTYSTPRITSQKTIFSVLVLVRTSDHMQLQIWLFLFYISTIICGSLSSALLNR